MEHQSAGHSFPPVEEQLAVIARGTVDLVETSELAERLKQSRATGRPLRVKLGIDPSSPDIHLGHTVVLRKLRDFQRLGHTVIVLWGTATARLGDPTGKNKTRPQLTKDEVDAHKATYKAQIGAVLDLDRIEERENGEWFDSMSFMDCVRLAAGTTVARMLERDSFADRYKAGEPISVHELLYPLMQGWDSVELRSDVELGGTDQLFNLHMGRELQRREGQPPQICITTPILVGLDGHEKMSKSLGNYVGVRDTPTDMFGKCMSVPDAAMRDWFTLVTDLSAARIDELLRGHPRTAKVELARAVTADYHGAAAADAAVVEFDRMFREGGRPDEVPEFAIPAAELVDGAVLVAVALAHCGICKSNSEGRRLIEGGGVRVDGERVDDPKAALIPGSYLLQSGRRKFAQVRVG
ncbi:MAG: tyrosine--tRNA ligase [Planctomycetes bacterium]|nr:tyrosine--tRNA ligase [Planctomycetota bacterium]